MGDESCDLLSPLGWDGRVVTAGRWGAAAGAGPLAGVEGLLSPAGPAAVSAPQLPWRDRGSSTAPSARMLGLAEAQSNGAGPARTEPLKLRAQARCSSPQSLLLGSCRSRSR